MVSFKKTLMVSAALLAVCGPAVAAETVADHGKPMHDEAMHEPMETRSDVAPAYVTPHHEDWGYDVNMGAHRWGTLDQGFQTCLQGKMQSPVNIDRYAEQEMPPLRAAYGQSDLKVVNNGHTIQVNYDSGSMLESDGTVYALKQIHFHTPSEHYIDGAPYPMEAHFVHQAENGELAIIGVMMKVGAKNETIEKIWAHIPGPGEVAMAKEMKISAANLLPRTGIYFKYDGSLTTPPCSEGVKWHVMQDPITISPEQLNAFQALYPLNARPVQPLNGRIVNGG